LRLHALHLPAAHGDHSAYDQKVSHAGSLLMAQSAVGYFDFFFFFALADVCEWFFTLFSLRCIGTLMSTSIIVVVRMHPDVLIRQREEPQSRNNVRRDVSNVAISEQ
jgi:hypothetical protein